MILGILNIRNLSCFLGLSLALSISATVAQASGNGALVEEIDSGVNGVSAFDTLTSGQTVDLRPDHRAIISYLDSCVRETINGGLVKIGTTQSDVQEGMVNRETLDCSVKQLTLTNATQDQSATTVFRPLFDNLVKQTVPDVSPFILAAQAKSLELKEMGKDAAPKILTLQNGKLDMRQAGIKLQPGGIYKLTAGSRETYIKILPDAQSESPLLMRLVKL